MRANDKLRQYTGTEVYHKFNSKCLLTDGAKAMADEFKGYWFLDVIASYQGPKLDLDTDGFQVWKLKIEDRGRNSTATITCTDGNNHEVRKQVIGFTDFEADEAELFVLPLDDYRRVILLPSEY